jgi:hypothetical protein
MERKLQELSVIELKALAYDTLAQLQILQNNMNIINQELNLRATPPPNQTSPVIPREPLSPSGTVQTL